MRPILKTLLIYAKYCRLRLSGSGLWRQGASAADALAGLYLASDFPGGVINASRTISHNEAVQNAKNAERLYCGYRKGHPSRKSRYCGGYQRHIAVKSAWPGLYSAEKRIARRWAVRLDSYHLYQPTLQYITAAAADSQTVLQNLLPHSPYGTATPLLALRT